MGFPGRGLGFETGVWGVRCGFQASRRKGTSVPPLHFYRGLGGIRTHNPYTFGAHSMLGLRAISKPNKKKEQKKRDTNLWIGDFESSLGGMLVP